MTTIDRDSPLPIYHQLKTVIRSQIEGGVWGPGEAIPTEKELCEQYGISRAPVRQALGELANEGLLVRRAGLGTFVATLSASQPAWSDDLLGTVEAGRLATGCPLPLRSYLHPGMHVLNAFCGPGSLTVDVALAVQPGSAVGVDGDQRAVEHAKALADKLQVTNASFEAADPHALQFPDDNFDLTFNINLLMFVRRPVDVLREHRRVTRPGGWVIAITGDWASLVVYPCCPALERWREAYRALTDPDDPNYLSDPYVGRKLPELFSRAGFEKVKIEAVAFCRHPGSGDFESWYRMQRQVLDVGGPFARTHGRLFALGAVDEETVFAAQKELEVWHAHPHALCMTAAPMVAAQVE